MTSSLDEAALRGAPASMSGRSAKLLAVLFGAALTCFAGATTGHAGVVAVTPFTGGISESFEELNPGVIASGSSAFGGNATLTEYYDRTKEENGDFWLVVTTIVDDPQYLQQPFITSTHFKLESDGSKWSPSPCTSR